MNLPVGVIRPAMPSLLIAHDAQDVRRTRLQHINNNHPDATAKHSQAPCPALQPPRRSLDKIIVPLTSLITVKWGAGRPLVSTQVRSSDVVTACFVRIPKRIVQVRFPSLASIAFEHAGALPP
jgi:hypothetical protein